jgi:LuxR family maltose regulon positive regulatory protein
VLTSLLNTKLYFPPVRPSLVQRPRLVERLQQGLKGPLTLVSAPAGSGKTTLLSEWRAGPGARWPATWLSLGADDNDMTRFLQYLLAALNRLKPGLLQEFFPILESPEPPRPEAVLTSLVNTLDGFRHDFLVALDDYHLIELPAIHNALAFLLDNMPPRMHLVLLTRADPPLPLARLRASGQLTEIRAEHLRFSVDETAQFLNQVMGLTLTPDQVVALEARSEGWIAGLQLAALSIQGHEDIQGFVSAFSGSHHYIVDYLAEEVLSRQSESLRAFLLKTSILERFTGALCDALTGDSDGDSVLARLYHDNLFIIPMDNDKRWYRYHHLFTDLLQSRLLHSYPETASQLHIRASRWFEANGFTDEAIGHALEATDFERAALLMGQCASTLSQQGRVETLEKWIGALPETIINRHPRLGLSLAWALYLDYKFDQSESRIQQIEHNLSTEDEPLYRGELALRRGIIARRHCDLEQSRESLLKALEQLPIDNTSSRGTAWVFLGAVYLESDVNRAQEAFIKAGDIFEAQNYLSGILAALYYLAWSQKLQGMLTQAAYTSRRALQLAEQVPHWPVASYAHLAAAELFCERNELERATQHAAKGTELAELGGHTDNLLIAALDASRVQRACGNWENAQALMGKAEELARPTIPWMKVQVMEEQVSLYLAQGKLHEAAEWLRQNQTPPKARSPIPWLHEQIILTRVRVARHESQEVLAQLVPLLEQAENLGILRSVIQIHCLQALAFDFLGQTGEARSMLETALAMAEPEGSIQVFLDVGPPMFELLRMARERELAPGFVSRLTTAFAGQGYKEAVQTAPAQGPLSRRELELLRLIAAGRSNKEIAGELVIAIGTVKRHTVNIFNKLDVKNRTEAVAYARKLGLL